MSEDLNELPEGWVSTTISELVDRLQYGYTARALDKTKGPRLIRITDIGDKGVDWSSVPGCNVSDDDFEKYKLFDGDILFARSGSIEKAWCVEDPPDSVFASYLIRGRPVETWVSEWLKHFVRSKKYLIQIGAAGAGIGMQNVNAKKLGAVKLNLPPLNEQKRIVNKIELLQARSQRAREALAEVGPLLEQFRQSVLAAAFRGDLTADWRAAHPDVEPASVLLEHIRKERRQKWEAAERAKYEAKGKQPPKNWQQKYQEPEPVDTTDLPELPEGWEWATIDYLSEIITSGSRGWAKYYANQGPTFLRVGNLDRNTVKLDLSETVHVQPPQNAEGVRTRVREKDILISVTADVGMVGLIPGDIGEAYINQHIALIRPLDAVNSYFMAFSLIDPEGLQKIVNKIQYGMTKASLSLVQIRSLPVPIPPSKEQHVILDQIDEFMTVLDTMVESLEFAQKNYTQLDQSILSKAFQGELVPQDPEDEPAADLLARIQAARAAEQVTQKKRTTRRKTKTATAKKN